jgi:hypothetical protein
VSTGRRKPARAAFSVARLQAPRTRTVRRHIWQIMTLVTCHSHRRPDRGDSKRRVAQSTAGVRPVFAVFSLGGKVGQARYARHRNQGGLPCSVGRSSSSAPRVWAPASSVPGSSGPPCPGRTPPTDLMAPCSQRTPTASNCPPGSPRESWRQAGPLSPARRSPGTAHPTAACASLPPTAAGSTYPTASSRPEGSAPSASAPTGPSPTPTGSCRVRRATAPAARPPGTPGCRARKPARAECGSATRSGSTPRWPARRWAPSTTRPPPATRSVSTST